MDVGGRPVTRAQRRFGAAELAGLDPREARRLCHALLLGDGSVIETYRPGPDFDEFLVSSPGLWRTHRALVSLFRRPVVQQDIERAVREATMVAAVDSLMLSLHDLDPSLETPAGVYLVSPSELADRITSSAIVQWSESVPTVSVERLELVLELDESTAIVDPIGIQWLPSLALNELPAALTSRDLAPQDLLEHKVFRIFTASFRFGGVRYGERERGQRLPDAVLFWPDGSSSAAMVDCKAASSGYRMESDHLLRFVRYAEAIKDSIEEEHHTLDYLIIVSSFFPGVDGQRHPYHGRAREIAEQTGLKLAYVGASDIAWAAAQLEISDTPLADRSRIDWQRILDSGLVTKDDFAAEFGGVW